MTGRLPANGFRFGAQFFDYQEPNPGWYVGDYNALSCASPGNCTAVGGYDDNADEYNGVLLTETHGRWGRGVQEPLPPNAVPHLRHINQHAIPQDNEPQAVSCAAPGDCTAVGFYNARHEGDEGLLLTETKGRWSPEEAPLPADAVQGPLNPGGGTELTAVSCGSVGNCAAVGDYESDNIPFSGVILTEAGGHWTAAPVTMHPDHHRRVGVVLQSVSCPSAGNCAAVGYYNARHGGDGVLVTETNGQWAKPTRAVLPANHSRTQLATDTAALQLSSVSCAEPGDCTAVGDYVSGGAHHQQGLMLTETNGVWAHAVEAGLPAGAWRAGLGPDVDLNSVSCASPGNCGAVGDYFVGQCTSCKFAVLLLTQTDGRWSTAVRGALPAGTAPSSTIADNFNAGLFSVSCGSPGHCTAVGSYPYDKYNEWGLRFTQSKDKWSKGVWVKP